jgi:hypothetical protein
MQTLGAMLEGPPARVVTVSRALPGSNQIEISELTASFAHGSHPGRLRVSAIRSCRRFSIAGRFPIDLHQRDKSPPRSSRAMRPAGSTVIGRWLGSKRQSDPNAAPSMAIRRTHRVSRNGHAIVNAPFANIGYTTLIRICCIDCELCTNSTVVPLSAPIREASGRLARLLLRGWT